MELKEIIGILVLLLGGGGIFAWRYAHRTERAKTESIEADVDLKQLELIKNYMTMIGTLSNEIDAALVTISVMNRDASELKAKFIKLKRVAQKLLDVNSAVNLTDEERELLQSGNTGDIYMAMPKTDRRDDKKVP